MKTIYVAGGCFWGLEKYIGLVNGVVDAEVGYANGANASATYGDGSGYAEAVKVVYDPKVAPLPFLLDLFYDAIEPTSVNRQGNDLGTEYRTGIYYTDPADEAVIEQVAGAPAEEVHGAHRGREWSAHQLHARRGLPPGLPREEPERLLPHRAEALRRGRSRAAGVGPRQFARSSAPQRTRERGPRMIDRLTGAVLAVLISLVAAVLLAACSQASEPESAATPSAAPSSTEPLPLGQSANVAGFTMTPTVVRDRPGPVYDLKGKPFEGQGIKVTVEVTKKREADIAAGELTVPVATVVDGAGQTVRMDDFLGMVPLDGQSAEYGRAYVHSYQYACIQSPGKTTRSTLWFSLPEGFVPETLVMDGGPGPEAAWLLE